MHLHSIHNAHARVYITHLHGEHTGEEWRPTAKNCMTAGVSGRGNGLRDVAITRLATVYLVCQQQHSSCHGDDYITAFCPEAVCCNLKGSLYNDAPALASATTTQYCGRSCDIWIVARGCSKITSETNDA